MWTLLSLPSAVFLPFTLLLYICCSNVYLDFSLCRPLESLPFSNNGILFSVSQHLIWKLFRQKKANWSMFAQEKIKKRKAGLQWGGRQKETVKVKWKTWVNCTGLEEGVHDVFWVSVSWAASQWGGVVMWWRRTDKKEGKIPSSCKKVNFAVLCPFVFLTLCLLLCIGVTFFVLFDLVVFLCYRSLCLFHVRFNSLYKSRWNNLFHLLQVQVKCSLVI